MPKHKLTDAFVKSAKPINGKLTEYYDTKERGLCLRVTASGVKAWTYRYRLKSRQQKRVALGKLIDVPLTNARALVVKQRALVASGGDPANQAILERQKAKEQRDKETVKDIGEWYFRECKAGRHRPNIKNPKRASTIKNEYGYFNRFIVQEFGKQKLATLKRASIQSFVNDLADNQSPTAARQSRIILHGIFAFAQRQELTDTNPCQFVTVAAQKARERVLTDSELKTIWETLTPPVNIKGACISASVAYSVLLAMVTLQRRGEVTGMSLAEIDRERRLWIIPSTRTKNHRTHTVPLSDLALELIEKALSVQSHKSDYIFPSPRDTSQPIKPAAMTRAFGRMKKALDLGDIRPHDLRRTGATNLTGEQLGFPRFTVSKVLNHTSDTGGAASVTGIYDQNEYLAEKRRALDGWALRVVQLTENAGLVSNVVNIHHTKN